MNRRGLTLLELLAVIAVVGVVATIGLSSLAEARAVQAIREDQSRVGQMLERGKSIARRYGQSTLITVRNGGREVFMRTVKFVRNYATGTDAYTDDPTVFSQTVRLEHTRLVALAGAPITQDTDIAFFSGPFGRLEMQRIKKTAATWTFNALAGSRTFDMDLVGVTGKPIFRPIETL